MNATREKMKIFLILIVIFLSGCELKKPLPPTKSFTLSLVDIEPQKRLSEDILQVTLPISDKVIMSNSILYDDDNSSLEAYTFAKWVDTPNAIIQKILKEAIISSNLFKSVITDYSNLRAKLELESYIIELKQIIKENSSIGVLKMRFYLIDLKSKDLIDTKEFEYKIVSQKINVYGAIDSFNLTMDKLTKELIEWLKNVVKK